MALTPTDGQAQKVCVFGMIVLQQSNRVRVSQNEQVSLTTGYNFNLEVSDIFFLNFFRQFAIYLFILLSISYRFGGHCVVKVEFLVLHFSCI